ncbi:MAG: helix-turn-helix domain-containing protein [Candidatus Poribacteria bacterium]|nr:helix-turn-helix domain-containing protein [Candidatus Poribacteria bacterium]
MRCDFNVTTLDINPITTESDYEVALREIQRLWEAPHGSPEEDKLDVMVTLVDAYEQQHYPIPPADPVETILHHMESQGMSRRELEPYLGSQSYVSEVLNRQRALTLDMIRKLHEGLGISADILVQPYQLQTA